MDPLFEIELDMAAKGSRESSRTLYGQLKAAILDGRLTAGAHVDGLDRWSGHRLDGGDPEASPAPAAQVHDLGVELMSRSMLIFETAGLAILVAMIVATTIALADKRQ